jgi:hypothetical protein
MKRLFALFLLTAAVAACDTTIRKEEIAGINYGPKPVRWQDEIRSYLSIRLTDPKDAVVEFRTEPKQLYQRETAVRKVQWGWAVCLWINDKNKQGAFDGFYPMTVFIRDEKIAHVNNGPEDFGIIGARYSREQCELLGAPFRK